MLEYLLYVTIVLQMVVVYKIAKMFIVYIKEEKYSNSSEWFRIFLIVLVLLFSSHFMIKLIELLKEALKAVIM